jgi:hypothetical protein
MKHDPNFSVDWCWDGPADQQRLPSPRGPSPKGRGAELADDGIADALEDALRHMQDLSVGEPEHG